jgi:hypothetical protein
MTDPKNTAGQRLTQIKDFLTMNKTATTIPWHPDCTKFPTRKELPKIPGAPAEAAWVWGDNDYACTILLQSFIADVVYRLDVSISLRLHAWLRQEEKFEQARLCL